MLETKRHEKANAPLDEGCSVTYCLSLGGMDGSTTHPDPGTQVKLTLHSFHHGDVAFGKDVFPEIRSNQHLLLQV